MSEKVKSVLIVVNTGREAENNQYAALIAAFIAKRIAKIEEVTVFYGPQGIEMTKKGTLSQFTLEDPVKKLIGDQLSITPDSLPDNLEEMAKLLRSMDVKILACRTFQEIEEISETEDFITPVNLLEALKGMEAEKIVYY